jgi:hypothetical protein
MIDLEHDGAVWILRMHAGENRFDRNWLDAVNAVLDQVEASDGPRGSLGCQFRNALPAARPRLQLDADWPRIPARPSRQRHDLALSPPS